MDFNKIVEKYPPGSLIDMVSELAIVHYIYATTDGDKLYMHVLFIRNINHSTDSLVFSQEDAAKYQVDKWRRASVRELYDELRQR